MTGFKDIQTVTVAFSNRDGVPTTLIIDGSAPGADLLARILVDDEANVAAITIAGEVPNGTGYEFKSMEDWEIKWVRRGTDGRSRPEPKPLGKVGQVILTSVSLAIVCPFIAILWAWAGGIYRSLG